MKRILSSSFVALLLLAAASSVAVAQSSSSPDPRVIAGTVNVFVFPNAGPAPDSEPDEEDSRYQRAHRTRLDDDGATPPGIFIRVPAEDSEPRPAEDQTVGAGLIGGIAQGSSMSPALASDEDFARGAERTGHGHGNHKGSPNEVSFAGHREADARCVSLALPLSSAMVTGSRSSTAPNGSAVKAAAKAKARSSARASTRTTASSTASAKTE